MYIPQIKSERRANRYRYRSLFSCGMKWSYRSMLARKFRVGPNQLRGKSALQLLRMYYTLNGE